MKRIASIMLLLSIMLVVTACGGEKNSISVTEATVPTEKMSDNPLIAAEVKTEYILNGSMTEVIGQRAYINISKDALKKITLEEYAEFCETVVNNSGYNWFSIICDDGTGIQFTGSQDIFASYGPMIDEGQVSNTIGTIWKTEDGYEYIEETSETVAAQPCTYPLNIDSTYADYAETLPDIIYTTTGEENGLGGTIYTFDGVVEEIYSFQEESEGFTFVYDNAIVQTDNGPVTVSNLVKAWYYATAGNVGEENMQYLYSGDINDYAFPEIGESATFYAVYMGYSMAWNRPVFCLGASADVYFCLSFDDPVTTAN